MALRPLLAFRNPDSTLDLNATQARIVDRAIFDGGALTLSSTSLQVTVDPFIASGYDGMVAISDDSETRTVLASSTVGVPRVSYLVLHLEYRVGTSPIANLQIVPETTWTTSVHNDFFITFARFELPYGTSALTDAGVVVDYSVGDWGEKLGLAGWKKPVADFASLPTEQNRDGDVRLTLDTHQVFVWEATTSSWVLSGGAVAIGNAQAASDALEAQKTRAFNGSGIVGSIDNDYSVTTGSGGFSHYGAEGLPVQTQPSVANQIDLQPLHAVINGHFVKTPYTELSLTAPAAGRYDLVYLEVWREEVADPATTTWDNDPTVGGTSTLSTIQAALETLAERHTSPNYGFSKIEQIDSTTTVVTRWQISSVAGVASGALHETSLAASSVTNIDGNVFAVATDQTDQRIWSAAATTSAYDDVSWAIPLLIVRRTTAETGPSAYIQETRPDDDDARYVFDVAPRAELGGGAAATSTVAQTNSTDLANADLYPSGWLRGRRTPFSYGAGTLTVHDSVIRVLGRDLSLDGSSVAVDLPSPPAASGRRDLVALEVFPTAHPPGNVAFTGPSELRRYPRQGLRSVPWIGVFRTYELTSELDEDDSMTAAGYTKSGTDPGLWSRPALAHEDQNADSEIWAIPVALVHRRNTAAYNPSTNPNGADRSAYPGLPNQSASLPFPQEVLDLRHSILEDASDVDAVLHESFQKLVRGELDTKFVVNPYDPSALVAGTKLLHVDRIASSTLTGHFAPAAAPDGMRRIWSESDEADLLCWSFSNPTVNRSDLSGSFAWTYSGGSAGVLTVTAPAGYHLSLTDENIALNFATTNFTFSPNAFGPGGLPVLAREDFDLNLRACSITETSTVSNGAGHVTQIVMDVTLPGAVSANMDVYCNFWAVKPNRDRDLAYLNNHSLFAVPETVHRAEVNGRRVHVGALTAHVTVTLAGAPPVAEITQADILAALPELASSSTAIRMYGIASYHIHDGEYTDTVSGLPALRYARLTDVTGVSPGLERIEVEFTAGTGAVTVDLEVMVSGDLVDSWVEVYPASKQVRGPYAWGYADVPHRAGASSITVERPTIFPHVPQTYQGWEVVSFSEVGLSPLGIRSPNAAAATPANNRLNADAQFLVHEAGSYTYWTDGADLVTVGMDGSQLLSYGVAFNNAATSEHTIGPRSTFYSVRRDYTATLEPQIRVVSPVARPLLSADVLRVWYTYSPYQGISSALENYLLGRVETIGDQVITTAGVNAPFLHPSVPGNNVSFPGTFAEPSTRGQDIGSINASGLDSGAIRYLSSSGFVREDLGDPRYRTGESPPVAISERLPYPADPKPSSVTLQYVAEGLLDYRTIRPAPADRVDTHVRSIDLGSGLTSSGTTWAYQTPSATESYFQATLSAASLVFPLVGSASFDQLVSVYADVYSDASSTPLSVWLERRLPGSSTWTSVLQGIFTVENLATVEGNTKAVWQDANPTFALTDVYDYRLRLETTFAGDVRLYGLRFGFTAVDSQFDDATYYYSTHVTDLSGGENEGNTLHRGAVFEIPASWTTEFTDLEGKYLSPGRSSYPLSPARGSTLRVETATSDLYGENFLAYLPGSDSTIRELAFNVVPPFGSLSKLELPRTYTVNRRTVRSYGTTQGPASGVLTALPYVMRTPGSSVYMGVSVGVNTLSSISVVAVGSALDAFHLVGRPLLKRD